VLYPLSYGGGGCRKRGRQLSAAPADTSLPVEKGAQKGWSRCEMLLGAAPSTLGWFGATRGRYAASSNGGEALEWCRNSESELTTRAYPRRFTC
jgi:hypothetical protein